MITITDGLFGVVYSQDITRNVDLAMSPCPGCIAMTVLKAFGLTVVLSALIIALMLVTGTGDPMMVTAPVGTF